MEMDAIVKMLVENGVTVGVLIYFMYTQNKTLEELRKAITELTRLVDRMQAQHPEN